MKRIIFVCLFALATFGAISAQNLQLHYDLGHSLYNDLTSRHSVTSVVEMFKPDKWGSTFLFTDIYYQRDGVSGAYWEIAREFDLTQNRQWAAHVEYNGGLTSDEETWQATRFQHAFLAGGAWNWHAADYSKTYSIQALYKYYFKNRHYQARPFSGFQLTQVWNLDMMNHLFTLSGFVDIWYDPNVNGNLIILSKPRFWLNLNGIKSLKYCNLSLGTELELSNNFVWNDKGQNNKFYAVPTIATKWTF